MYRYIPCRASGKKNSKGREHIDLFYLRHSDCHRETKKIEKKRDTWRSPIPEIRCNSKIDRTS